MAPSPSDDAVGLAEKVTGMPVPRPLTPKNTIPSPTDNAIELVEEATGTSVLTTKRSKKKPKKRTTTSVLALTAFSSTSSSLVPGSGEISSQAVAPFASVPVPAPNIVAGPKHKQMEGEDQLEELGPHKRKPTKRARGLDYDDDSTLSDKEKRTGITKQGHKHRST